MKRLLLPLLLAGTTGLSATAAAHGFFKNMGAASGKRISLHFTTSNGEPFPSPLVRVTIAGHPSSMIVDTGSTDIVLSQSMVQRLGLKVSATKGSGPDASGRNVSVAELSEPHITVQGWGRVARARVLAAALPGVFNRLGIAGVLSPQRLVGPGMSVVISLASHQLLVVPNAVARTYVASQRGAKSSPVACHNVGDMCLYSVKARIAGHAAQLLLDTGASITGIAGGSPAGRELIKSSHPSDGRHYVASGKVATCVLPFAKLSVGGVKARLKVLISPRSYTKGNGLDGRLGMNYLRRCTLVVGHTGGTLVCK